MEAEQTIEVMGEYVARGEYVEGDPPRRVVLTWLRHRDLPSAEAAAQHRTGWEHYLGRLSIVAAGGDPGPDSGPSGPEDAPR